MTPFPQALVIIAAIVAPLAAAAGPPSPEAAPGLLYQPAYPAPFFGAPVPISDRDESSTARSQLTVRHDGGALLAEFEVVPNATLGYAYAGIAIPFPAPLALDSGSALSFDVRGDGSVPRLEVVMRDAGRRRAVVHVTLDSPGEWQPVTIPAAHFASIDGEHVQSAAFVVVDEGRGVLELRDVRIPVVASTAQLSALQRVQFAPKWHVNAGHARAIASARGVHLVTTARELPEAWSQPLLRTINLLDPSLPSGSVLVHDARGALVASLDAGDASAPQALAALLPPPGETRPMWSSNP